MKPAEGLNYLFLDLNSYFASVEQQERPELRGRPVAVVPMDTDSTCAIAASYEAKAFGVKTGTKIYKAKQLCPDLVLVPARHDVYATYHRRIMGEMERHAPIDKIHSIDEAAIRLTGPDRAPDRAVALARSIKRGIADNVGAHVKSSVGIAANRFLAKVSTDLQKPDGLVVLPNEKVPERIFPLALTDLPGINRRMEDRLLNAHISSIEDFWNISPAHARKIWGGVQGERFWYALHGYEIPELETTKRMIGHSRVLAPSLRPQHKARLVGRSLLLKAAKRLRRYGLCASSLTLGARHSKTAKFKGEVRFAHTHDSFVFLKNFNELWDQLVKSHGAYAQLSKVSLALHGLKEAEALAPDLFDWAQPVRHARLVKHQRLWGTLDGLHKRYGRDCVTLASQMPVRMHDLGTKIAFARIPDEAEFLE